MKKRFKLIAVSMLLAQMVSLVNEVISENEKAITDYHNGRTNMLDYLVGQVMKKSRGKANPVKAKEIILRELDARK